MIDILLYLLYYQQAKQASLPQTKDEIKMGIFCHAKLDYFYGAIYSTKFTTTLAGSAIFLKANVRANVRRGPNTMKICGRVWGLFEPPSDGSSHRLDLGST